MMIFSSFFGNLNLARKDFRGLKVQFAVRNCYCLLFEIREIEFRSGRDLARSTGEVAEWLWRCV